MVSLRERQKRVRERGEAKRATWVISPVSSRVSAFANARMIGHGRRGGKMLNEKHHNVCVWTWYLVFVIPSWWVGQSVLNRWKGYDRAQQKKVAITLVACILVPLLTVWAVLSSFTEMLVGLSHMVGVLTVTLLVVVIFGIGAHLHRPLLLESLAKRFPALIKNPFTGSQYLWPAEEAAEARESHDSASAQWELVLYRVVYLPAVLVAVALLIVFATIQLVLVIASLLYWLWEAAIWPALKWLFSYKIRDAIFTPFFALYTIWALWSFYQVWFGSGSGQEATGVFSNVYVSWLVSLTAVIGGLWLLSKLYPSQFEEGKQKLADVRYDTSERKNWLGRLWDSIGAFFALIWTFILAKKWGVCARLEFSPEVYAAFGINPDEDDTKPTTAIA